MGPEQVEGEAPTVPWWVFALSIAGALLLLALAVAILYKVSFYTVNALLKCSNYCQAGLNNFSFRIHVKKDFLVYVRNEKLLPFEKRFQQV